MIENKGFRGKELIELTRAKGWESVILRLQARYQTLEFTAQGTHGRRTIQEAGVGADLGTADFVFMYAHQHDTTWRYFVQGLKPSDYVSFACRDGGSELTKERGLRLTDVRARVRRYNKAGDKLLAEYETTIHREVRDVR